VVSYASKASGASASRFSAFRQSGARQSFFGSGQGIGKQERFNENYETKSQIDRQQVA